MIFSARSVPRVRVSYDQRSGLPEEDRATPIPEFSIGPATPDDAEQLARLHQLVLPAGFLAQLGVSVLTQIYVGILSAPGTVTLCARVGGQLGGFILGTRDTGRMFRHVLLRRGHRLALLLALEVARRPRILARLLESLGYPARLAPASSPGDGELVALGVAPELRGCGCGLALVNALSSSLRSLRVGAYTVSFYDDNDGASGFYKRCGFEPIGQLVMYERSWSVYRLDVTAAEPDR